MFTLLNISKEIILVPGYIENWIIIIDLEGFLNRNELIETWLQNFLPDLIETFQLNYPNYLEKLYLINFSHTFLDFLQAFRLKLSSNCPDLLEKIITLSKEELGNLQESIDKTQIELKYGGSYPNYSIFWPPKNIINHQILKYYYHKKDTHQTEFFYLNASEEDAPKRKNVPKFKELSYSPIQSQREFKMKINRFRNSEILSKSTPVKFHQHRIFESAMPKQFLFDDLESIASSTSRYSEPTNPLSLKLRKNKFIEDLYEQPFKAEEAEIIRASYARESTTKELCQNYFDEKFQQKTSSSLFDCFLFIISLMFKNLNY